MRIGVLAAVCAVSVWSGEILRLGDGSLLTLDAREFRLEGEGFDAPPRDWQRFRSANAKVIAEVKQVAPGVLHVAWTLSVPQTARLKEVTARFRFMPSQPGAWEPARRDFHWIPNIKLAPHQIAADHVFRSPAVMAMSGRAGVAIIPDLDVLRESRPAPQFLDMRFPENEAPLIEYGITESKPEGHTYYTRTGELFAPQDGEVRFACYVLLRPSTTREALLRETTAFLWSRFAGRYTAQIEPQTVPFRRYAEYGFDWALNKLWVNGPAAGTGGITLSTFLNKETGEFAGRWFPKDLWFQSWFNNTRTAWGLHYWGKVMNRPEWVERSRAVVRLILAAPREQGLFATLYRSHDGKWQSSGQGGGPEVYHLPDNAWTALWVARFHQEREPMAGAPEFLADFARALLRLQHEDGSFPTRVFTGSLKADPVLDRSASEALPLWFLAEMLDRRLLPEDMQAMARAALLKGAAHLRKEVLPRQKFEDFELYLSCSKKPFTFYDKLSELGGQNTLAIQWSAEALRLTHKLTGDASWLRNARFCLDLLSLYQQVWSPPYLSLNGFGGFGVMNTDAEWNDARQAQFAETYANFYDMTGEAEYMERAIAAARASFTLVVMEENRTVAPRNYQGVAKNGETHGASAENYGHAGRDQRAFMSGFHWGTGSAIATAAILTDRYSGVYVEVERRQVFGIDGAVASHARWGPGNAVSFDLKAVGPLTGRVSRPISIIVNGEAAPVKKDESFSISMAR